MDTMSRGACYWYDNNQDSAADARTCRKLVLGASCIDIIRARRCSGSSRMQTRCPSCDRHPFVICRGEMDSWRKGDEGSGCDAAFRCQPFACLFGAGMVQSSVLDLVCCSPRCLASFSYSSFSSFLSCFLHFFPSPPFLFALLISLFVLW
ncbi:hypothetical protein GGS23DRAFT_575879 [Durotheca rogersii]|uniref:uncharacterized protein n=1 Tax=Durotheca rogersii TaxID=419775 RepID=UPI0022211CCA|nr:uncharacterized protein GGS23DRAFT_575879 [Durotheca rogersii]KAI5861612.1 hypothetical protein GGS23DRAFT_575879 [Durotheca rogersii]